jgi:DNA replication protein DnaD
VETDNKDKYRLMTRKEFKEEWKKRFEEFKAKFGRNVPTESEQLNCMVMDFIFYATVVEERFKVTIDEVDKVKVEDVEKLRRKLS